MFGWFQGITAEVFSGAALAISGYGLWQTSLKGPKLRLFVPSTIRYASPYQNSYFEVFEVPVTLSNEGARAGTVLMLELLVTNRASGETKRFYSGGTGTWNLAKARAEGFSPFTPIVVGGRSSQSVIVLFYARHDSTVLQIVDREGIYDFALSTALSVRKGAVTAGHGKTLTFPMNLPILDHRAFTHGDGTLSLHHPEMRPTAQG